jgi:hypothetical protein
MSAVENVENGRGPDGISADYRARVAAANINEETLLATDYLNHFNEIVMLIDMVPDMPECLEDAQEWQPKSYPDHFRDSAFTEKELAIEAYEKSPLEYRDIFDETVAQMNQIVQAGVARLAQKVDASQEDELRLFASNLSRKLQSSIDVASAIIHGAKTRMAQDEIDEMLRD